MHALLQQRLAAGDFDEAAAEALDLGDDFADLHLAPFVKGVLGIAPRAPQIASGEPDEHAGASGPGRFALDAVEDLVYPNTRHFNKGFRGRAGGAPRRAPPRSRA